MTTPLPPAQTERGFSIPLSVPRRLVNDIITFAKRIPTVPVQRVINIGHLSELRSQSTPRIGWCSIFTKAFAIVAAEMPEFRRAYLSFPWQRLYQHPVSIASIAIERSDPGWEGVYIGSVNAPDQLPLQEIEEIIKRYKNDPLNTAFGSLIRFGKLPGLIRRFLIGYAINLRGSRKAQFLGTFGVSAYSALGAESLHPISPLTTLLNYGVIAPNGNVTVRIVYDHRVMDGSTVARALARLDDVLQNEMAQELHIGSISASTGQLNLV